MLEIFFFFLEVEIKISQKVNQIFMLITEELSEVKRIVLSCFIPAELSTNKANDF